MTPVDDFLPLAPATLHILLSLAGGGLHGYGIMQDVLHQSGGKYKLGPGTLYDNLQRLMKQALVEEIDDPAGENSRRRCYQLTTLGRALLSAEIARLEGVLKHAKPLMRAPRSTRA